MIFPFVLSGFVMISLYGAIHDQISYTVSPEYFIEFKFRQFNYINLPLNIRGLVSVIGIIKIWWFGDLCDWFFARFRFNIENLATAKKILF